jgi:hypothetical protein
MAGVDDWMAVIQIQQLIYRYFDAMNHGDIDMVRSLFVDNAVWEEPILGQREESADAFAEMLRRETAGAEVFMMTPHCPTITLVGPDAARASTTFQEFGRGTAAGIPAPGSDSLEYNATTWGIYHDEIARVEGSWKFTHRRADLIYHESGGVTGDVLLPRASLLHMTTA